MMTFRKISAGGMGKLIRAYLTENSNFAPEPDEGSNAAALTKYYGRDARASWRQALAPEVAEALGIDIAKPPTPEALDRLFEAKRGNDGGPWSAASRDISAYDLTISPEKSVSLAFAFAKTDEERAALLQAIWRANDRTMRYVAQEIGWARRGDACSATIRMNVVLPHPKMLPRRRELSQPNAPWFLSPLAAAKPSRVTDDARSDVPVSAWPIRPLELARG